MKRACVPSHDVVKYLGLLSYYVTSCEFDPLFSDQTYIQFRLTEAVIQSIIQDFV